MPSGPTNLRAFHSMGLWLAVSTIPPAARWCSTASWTVGVGTRPTSITPHPTDIKPAVAARANMGPDVRASRPRTTDGPLPRLPTPDSWLLSLAHAPNAAAQRATISGVRSVPTSPRTPDTLTIRVSDMAVNLTSQSGATGFHHPRGEAERL